MTLTTVRSVLRCPQCGYEDDLDMPSNACVFVHECGACRVLLRAQAGDCCVFCSYGSVPCPPIQRGCSDGGSTRSARVSDTDG